ncbi:hypothetical protein BJ085DRAFT_38488 [Dimargaris cristalligena]|uniref:Uncharacterized protein n=1 Tax=Dimargaris cristalligena TaxID=215637 RepID=A0A4P9ZX10_9FUNG|nr:hypothetical protein BJ085DRAFT_38488 [Dimargaris cristalligena]|eukprot:RKP37412.1 hypothetical protein BJ085DRAFT_38488 [Dimargaris cristalligena]
MKPILVSLLVLGLTSSVFAADAPLGVCLHKDCVSSSIPSRDRSEDPAKSRSSSGGSGSRGADGDSPSSDEGDQLTPKQLARLRKLLESDGDDDYPVSGAGPDEPRPEHRSSSGRKSDSDSARSSPPPPPQSRQGTTPFFPPAQPDPQPSFNFNQHSAGHFTQPQPQQFQPASNQFSPFQNFAQPQQPAPAPQRDSGAQRPRPNLAGIPLGPQDSNQLSVIPNLGPLFGLS